MIVEIPAIINAISIFDNDNRGIPFY